MTQKVLKFTKRTKGSGCFKTVGNKGGQGTRDKGVCEDNAMFCSVCKEAAAVHATISHKNGFMKEVLYEVRCLKSNEDMILALAGQFKHVS